MSDGEQPAGDKPQLQEVRYSLKALLAEVEHERSNSAVGREMVDQGEINTLFKKKKKRKRARKTQ